MGILSVIDWSRLDACVLDLAASESFVGLESRLLDQALLLFPTELNAAVFGLDAEHGHSLVCTAGAPVEPRWLDLWHRHFRYRLPGPFALEDSVRVVRWTQAAGDEYSDDFVLPQGIRQSLYIPFGPGPGGGRRALVVHRPKGSRFGEKEIEIAALLRRHLTRLCSIHERLRLAEGERVSGTEALGPGNRLSKREAEVASFLCRRLTIAEIGTRLGLSSRTVETYMRRACDKLKVQDRTGLIRTILASPPGAQASVSSPAFSLLNPPDYR